VKLTVGVDVGFEADGALRGTHGVTGSGKRPLTCGEPLERPGLGFWHRIECSGSDGRFQLPRQDHGKE